MNVKSLSDGLRNHQIQGGSGALPVTSFSAVKVMVATLQPHSIMRNCPIWSAEDVSLAVEVQGTLLMCVG